MKRALAVLLALVATASHAEPLEHSPRPVARGETPALFIPAPPLRPLTLLSEPQKTPERTAMDPNPATEFAVLESPDPRARTASVAKRAKAVLEARRRGQVCGDAAIQGEVIPAIDGPGACGVDNPVRIRSIAGVTFNQRPTIDCRTAVALKNWIVKSAIPEIGSEGGGLKRINLMGHYSCRTRNSQAGARLSEHAFGRAVDIGAFSLRDGSVISVKTGWGTRADGRQLRNMHRAACGPFGTVLGPNANAAHHDHFHFDTARYRSGSYCR